MENHFIYYNYYFICYTWRGMLSGRGNRLRLEHMGQILVIFRTTGTVHDTPYNVLSIRGAFSLVTLSEQTYCGAF